MEFKKHHIDKTNIPIFVPAVGDKEPTLVIAEGALHRGKLTITFNDRLPAQAIQRMLAQHMLLGLAFVLMEVTEGPEGEVVLAVVDGEEVEEETTETEKTEGEN